MIVVGDTYPDLLDVYMDAVASRAARAAAPVFRPPPEPEPPKSSSLADIAAFFSRG